MKRYYKRSTQLPEDVDRLEAGVRLSAAGLPTVTEEQIARLVDENFLGRDMKQGLGYVIKKHGAWEAAMNVARNGSGCNDGNSKRAWRAAWALEWAYEHTEPKELPEWLFDRMVDDFAASTNGGVQRIYAKMLCDQMRFGGSQPSYSQAEKLTEKCFDLVTGSVTKTATTFWCLEILFELAPRIDWVASELPETVRLISENPGCSPGMRVATREILKRLKSVGIG